MLITPRKKFPSRHMANLLTLLAEGKMLPHYEELRMLQIMLQIKYSQSLCITKNQKHHLSLPLSYAQGDDHVHDQHVVIKLVYSL